MVNHDLNLKPQCVNMPQYASIGDFNKAKSENELEPSDIWLVESKMIPNFYLFHKNILTESILFLYYFPSYFVSNKYCFFAWTKQHNTTKMQWK